MIKTVAVLLANSDRRLNNLIEVAVRNVCYDQLHVECSTTWRLDELLHRGCLSEFGLIFVAPDHLVSGPSPRATQVRVPDAARVIRTIKHQRAVPIIAVGVNPQDEQALLEAGADHAFGILFNRDALGAQVRTVLNLRDEVAEEPASTRWSFATGLLRGWQRLRET